MGRWICGNDIGFHVQINILENKNINNSWKTNFRINFVQHSLGRISAAQSLWEFLSLMPLPGNQKWIFRVHPQRDQLPGIPLYHSLFLNSWNFHKRDYMGLVNLFLIDDKNPLSKMVKKTKDVYQANKKYRSKEVKAVGIPSAWYWKWKAPGRQGVSSLYLTSHSCSVKLLFPDV